MNNEQVIREGVEAAFEDRAGWRTKIAAAVRALTTPAAPDSGESVDEVACWSCKRLYTAAQRLDADGNCPHCGVEIELEEGDAFYASAASNAMSTSCPNGCTSPENGGAGCMAVTGDCAQHKP